MNNKLHKIKILCDGNMLNFIKHFLSDRTFQVKINGFLPSVFKQENSVPQGSTISVTLFLIVIHNLCEEIKFPVKSTLYADDLKIWCCGKNTNNIQHPISKYTLIICKFISYYWILFLRTKITEYHTT